MSDQTSRRRGARPPRVAAAKPALTLPPPASDAGFIVGFDEWAQVRADAMRGAGALRMVRDLEQRLKTQEAADSYVARFLDDMRGQVESLVGTVGELAEELRSSVRSSDLYVAQSIEQLRTLQARVATMERAIETFAGTVSVLRATILDAVGAPVEASAIGAD